MQQLTRLALSTLLACFAYLCTTAQNCNADFSYTVGYSKVVTFIAHDSLGATSRWTFGDGSAQLVTGNGAITHIYQQPGQYEVKHFIEKPNSNCKDSVVKIITVEWLDNCKAYFYTRKQTASLTYEFINASSTFAGLKQGSWDFGDGTTGNTTGNLTHTYTKPGTYTVCLRIETNSGCKSESCQTFQVIDSSNICAITAKYSYKRDTLDCRKINFTNLSTPISPNVHFTWNFGDGGMSDAVNPSHIYNQPGKYYVCLVSKSVDSTCRKEYCDTVIVKCDTVPNPCNITAKYTYRRDSLDCKKIRFTNLSNLVSPNVHFVWKFGDGTTSNDLNPSHVYAQSGRYYVCLVSEAGAGCRKEYCDSVIVKCDTVPAPCNITARYSYKRDSLNCRTIRFSNLSMPIVATTVHFIWKFGDGSTSNDIIPSHTYNQPGKYYVCLVSESIAGCRTEYCDSVIVKCNDTITNPTPCNVSARFEKRHENAQWNKVWFNNLSQPITNIRQTYWSYGDGGTSTSQDFNTFHTYANAGVYLVCLKVVSLNGCTSTYCDTVIVQNRNCDSFTVKYEYAATPGRPNEIVFKAVSKQALATQVWTIYKDNSSSPVAELTHNGLVYKFNDTGWYKVCLTATVAGSSCVKQYCARIHIATVATGGVTQTMAWPNPAVNTISLDVPLDRPGQVLIKIMDGNGAVSRVFSKNGTTGNNRFVLPVDGLSQGFYLVEIRTSSKSWLSRFQKG